jgi:hypothetical protein
VLYGVLWYALALRLGTSGDPRTWIPLPLFPALLVGALRDRYAVEPGRAEWLCAAVFVGLTAAVWPPDAGAAAVLSIMIGGVLVFKAALVAGVLIGGAAVQPSRRLAPAVPLVLGVLVPLALGLVDLRMRTLTP